MPKFQGIRQKSATICQESAMYLPTLSLGPLCSGVEEPSPFIHSFTPPSLFFLLLAGGSGGMWLWLWNLESHHPHGLPNNTQWHPTTPSGTQQHPVTPNNTQGTPSAQKFPVTPNKGPVAPSNTSDTQQYPVTPNNTKWDPMTLFIHTYYPVFQQNNVLVACRNNTEHENA